MLNENEYKYCDISVFKLVKNIEGSNYLMPSIQREFVWSKEKIEKLFDSLMKRYPITTFLFWPIKNENKSKFDFYDFLKEYYNTDNPTKNCGKNHGIPNQETELYGVLDGQQRLTSFNIGIRGCYIDYDKEKVKIVQKLCINILYEPNLNDNEDNYDIAFVDNNNIKKQFIDVRKNENKEKYEVHCFYVPFEEFYGWSDETKQKRKREIIKVINGNDDLIDTADSLIDLTWATLNRENLSYYCLSQDMNYDNVLETFVRINSGGEKLEYADLLLSTIVAKLNQSSTWENPREEITSLIDDLYQKKFIVSKDFVLKTGLFLLNVPIAFKVANFGDKVIELMSIEWNNISKAILNTFECLKSMGFTDERIGSYNAIIPIIYYCYKQGNLKNSIEEIYKYLNISFIRGVFGGSADNTLLKFREIINGWDFNNKFDYKSIQDNYTSHDLYIYKIQKEDIDRMLSDFSYTSSYGKAYWLLCLLYPNKNVENHNFDIDHMHPRAAMKTRKSKIPSKNFDVEFWFDNRDKIGNLQLLSSPVNRGEKNDMSLFDFLDKYSDYKSNNFLEKCDEKYLSISNFKTFFIDRENRIKEELYKKLL